MTAERERRVRTRVVLRGEERGKMSRRERSAAGANSRERQAGGFGGSGGESKGRRERGGRCWSSSWQEGVGGGKGAQREPIRASPSSSDLVAARERKSCFIPPGRAGRPCVGHAAAHEKRMVSRAAADGRGEDLCAGRRKRSGPSQITTTLLGTYRSVNRLDNFFGGNSHSYCSTFSILNCRWAASGRLCSQAARPWSR